MQRESAAVSCSVCLDHDQRLSGQGLSGHKRLQCLEPLPGLPAAKGARVYGQIGIMARETSCAVYVTSCEVDNSHDQLINFTTCTTESEYRLHVIQTCHSTVVYSNRHCCIHRYMRNVLLNVPIQLQLLMGASMSLSSGGTGLKLGCPS